MAHSQDWKDIACQLERLLRLRTFPIGINLYEDETPLDQIHNLRTPTRKTLPCQLITLARTIGWTIGVTLDKLLAGSPCAAMVGFDERRKVDKEGTYRSAVWFESKEEGAKCEQAFPHLPLGKYRALVLGLLEVSSNPSDRFLVFHFRILCEACALVDGIRDVAPGCLQISQHTNHRPIIEAVVEIW